LRKFLNKYWQALIHAIRWWFYGFYVIPAALRQMNPATPRNHSLINFHR